MPWEHGTYFSKRDIEKIRSYLQSQGLNDTQVAAVEQWHRSTLAKQLAIWCTLPLFIAAGFTVAFISEFSPRCVLF